MTRTSQSTGSRIIQLHPSLRCNLRCKHCYSSSAPEFKTGLDQHLFNNFLDFAADYGFNTLAVSGGEPFLYNGIEEVLTKSKALKFKNLVASNGMLLRSARAKRVLSLIDVLAISIDGDEAMHDNLRAMKGAYAKMLEGVDILSKLGKKFGFIHTVTPDSWRLLPWLAEFSYEKGAKLLQLHPLELYGRAKLEFKQDALTQAILHKVYILGNFFKSKYYGEMFVQLDFLHKKNILDNPFTVAYYGNDFEVNQTNFSQAIQSIIVDEKGDILPIAYGFSNHYKIGNIREVANGIDVFERFIQTKWKNLYQVLAQTFDDIQTNNDDLIAWTELIVKNSSQQKYQWHAKQITEVM